VQPSWLGSFSSAGQAEWRFFLRLEVTLEHQSIRDKDASRVLTSKGQVTLGLARPYAAASASGSAPGQLRDELPMWARSMTEVDAAYAAAMSAGAADNRAPGVRLHYDP
jgi:hypothetical protein